MGALSEKPVKLPIKPKPCKHCGRPFVPVTPNNVFCPKCKELSQGKRDRSLFAKHAEEIFGPGPWSKDRINADPQAAPLPEWVRRAMIIARTDCELGSIDGYVTVNTYLTGDHKFVPGVQVTPQAFLELFEARAYTATDDRLYGFIDDVYFVAVLA